VAATLLNSVENLAPFTVPARRAHERRRRRRRRREFNRSREGRRRRRRSSLRRREFDQGSWEVSQLAVA